MGAEFWLYLRLGYHHIADLAGTDHLLFIAALTIGYAPREWRRLAVLVTAFTVGHSVTLALATMRVVSVPTRVVEALIPVTIVVTSLLAVYEQQRLVRNAGSPLPVHAPGRYVLAATFGLIHGLGFSTYLRAILGREESIALPLFAFNVGLEVGQLLILAVVVAAGVLAGRWLGLARRDWVHVVAGATGGVALVLLVERLAQPG